MVTGVYLPSSSGCVHYIRAAFSLPVMLNQVALTDKECSISATGFRWQLHPNARVHTLSSFSMTGNELFPLKV